MSNIVPIVISGQIAVNQTSILMSIIDNTPYYLVADINGVPYFQPLYYDVNVGEAVFASSAARVRLALSAIGGEQRTVTITNIAAPPVGGDYIVDVTTRRVIAPRSLSTGIPGIPIEDFKYLDPTLIACGYQYTLDQDYRFFLTDTWYPNPGAQAIASIATSTSGNFYVFPVEGVVDALGMPADSIVFSTIYQDVLGIKPAAFLFSSIAAKNAGAGLPYQFCSVTQCGPDCYGLCNGEYPDCHRQFNETFACSVEVSPSCKALFTLPFLAVMGLFLIGFFVVLYRVRHNHKIAGRPATGNFAYAMPLSSKIWLAATMFGAVAVCIVLLLLISLDSATVDSTIRRYCAPVGYS